MQALQRVLAFLASNSFTRIFTWLLVLVIVINHYLIYVKINLVHIDSDQPFMWIGAADYAKGFFPEPRFYGQDYNTFMEALFAVPFIWMGMSVYEAVPLTTHIIFLFPIFFTVFYLRKKGYRQHALLILAVFACMTTDFDIMTSIPRGFITGLFFTSFFVVSMLRPDDLKYVAINTAGALIANSVNPNTLLLSGPFLFYLFLVNFRNRKYYLFTLAGLLVQVPLYLVFDKFYRDHPEYITHGLQMFFGVKHFVENMPVALEGFIHLSPFSRHFTIFWPAAFVVVGVFLYRLERKAFWAFLLTLFIFLVSQFTGKVRDGYYWAYFSFSRMYLALPMLFALFCLFIPLRRRALAVILLVASLTFIPYKFTKVDAVVSYHTDETQAAWLGVHLVKLPNAIEAIEYYDKVCKQHHARQFIVSNFFWLNTFLDYGGPALYSNYTPTQETQYEKRLYRKREGESVKADTLIFLAEFSVVDTLLQNQPFRLKRLDDYGLFLVTNNKLTNNEFIAVVLRAEKRLRKLQGRDLN